MPSIAHASTSTVVDVVDASSNRRASYSLPFDESSPISDVLNALGRNQSRKYNGSFEIEPNTASLLANSTMVFSLSTELRFAVTTGEPCYDASDPRGLLISE